MARARFTPRGKRTGAFRKKRATGRRAIAISRTLSYSLPQIMKLSLVASTQNNYQVAAGQYIQQVIPAVSVLQIGGTYPSNFGALMRLYSRCQVLKCTWDLRITTINDNDALNVAAAVISYIDTARIPDAVTMDQLRGMPRSKTAFVGIRQGGSAVLHMSFSVDVGHFLTGYSNDALMTTSADTIPMIVQPPQLAYGVAAASVLASPALLIIETPIENNQSDFQITRKITYTCMFSSPHAGLNTLP